MTAAVFEVGRKTGGEALVAIARHDADDRRIRRVLQEIPSRFSLMRQDQLTG